MELTGNAMDVLRQNTDLSRKVQEPAAQCRGRFGEVCARAAISIPITFLAEDIVEFKSQMFAFRLLGLNEPGC